MTTITDKIIKRIRNKRRGWVFTPKDFLALGTRVSVDQILSRLVKQGMISKLDRGIYYYPKTHKLIGVLSPHSDKVARAVTARTGDIAYPTGAMAANILGLSTQVPAKISYMVNGPSRTKKINGITILFKHARVPLIDNVPDTVNYTLQALFYLGKDSIDSQIINRLAKILSSRDMHDLHKATSLIPSWMADTIHKIQKVKDGQLRKAS